MKKKNTVYLAVTLCLGLSTFSLSAPAGAKSGETRLNETYGTPSFSNEVWVAPKNVSKQQTVLEYLNAKKDQFKFAGTAQNHFDLSAPNLDSETGTYYFRLYQKYQGVPVYGADSTLHFDKSGNVSSYLGMFVPGLEEKQNLRKQVKLNKHEAVEIAVRDLEQKLGTLSDYQADPKAALYVLPYQGEFYLAYLTEVNFLAPEPGRYHYFIDATNGDVLNAVNLLDHVTGSGTGVLGDTKSIETTLSSGSYYLLDSTRGSGIQTYTSKNRQILPGWQVTDTDNFFTDRAAVDAHAYAEQTYDYYKNVHGRNSFDGNGALIKSSAHYGRNYNNAFWNGVQMVYGDGDGVQFIPLSGGLDVVAHELTHAVTEKTADLTYSYESGALNESISDIFGAMLDTGDWLIGEDVYTPGTDGDALRSMEDPTKYGDPDHYSKRYTGSQDNGGVHINSGINNKAAYLLANGGTHYGITVSGIGRADTAKIYYRALTQHLTSSSNFAQMRLAAVQSATELFGANSQQVISVQNAYSAVGVN